MSNVSNCIIPLQFMGYPEFNSRRGLDLDTVAKNVYEFD